MRKSKRETAETRRRIVATAAAEFRRKGINSSALSDVMTAAGLTHGGFYRHFESKEQLVAEACAVATGKLAEDVAKILSGKAKRKGRAVAATYLSTAHRDDPANGCTLAALGSELARSDEATRATATKGFLALVNLLAGDFDGCRADVARRRALAAASTMIGAMTMARVVTDPDLSVAILRSAAKSIVDE